MTKQEFLKYVKDFKKEPGEFTKDEIYQIGVEHKKLLKEDKSWEEVVNLVGWNGSGEKLRNFVNSRMKREGILPTNKNVLSEKTIEEVNDDDLSLIKEELIKERIKTRDEWNAYRRFLREDARLETFKDLLKDSISKLEELPKVKYVPSINRPKSKEAILMLSDLHIGVKCENFYNTYNLEVAMERLDKLVEDTINYCKLTQVSKLIIVNLGDCIHGIIHLSARVEQEFDVVDQVTKASELLARTLNKLQKACPTIIYRSVVDNHSRFSPNKDESIESENMSRIIDWYLQERLRDTSIQFKFDNIDNSIGKFTLDNGKVVMFAHGHLDNLNQSFQHFVGATGEFVDYILLGHYHCEKVKSYQGARVFVNGSIVGTEQYALSKRLFSKPSQTLLVFDKDNLINISINLDIKD